MISSDDPRTIAFPFFETLNTLLPVSDESKQPLGDLLSGMSLGPAWAKPSEGKEKSGSGNKFRGKKGGGRRDDRRDERGGGKFRNDRRGRRDDRPPRKEVLPAPGVEVSLVPAVEALHLIAKEIQHEARVYPLFNVAKTLLAERARCRAVFEVPEPHPFLWRGLKDESIFLTREEALQHLWRSEVRQQQVEEESIETEPPKGSFSAVVRCGVSGEWLGPPNFHGYQIKLKQFHRDRFSHLPFESYAAKVRVEKGEEAVNEWLATMTKKTRWRLKGEGDDAWTEDESQIRRRLAEKAFDEAFEEARCVEVNAAIPPSHLSTALMASMKQAGNHARNHPAFLIPAICKVIDAEHMPLFKRQKKLYTGPARPKPVAPDQVFAERPGIIVKWIRENAPAKLKGLWKEVSPEGDGTPPAEYAADLFWLLQQGHILLFPDDTLVVQELREPPKPSAKKKKKGKPAESPKKSTEGEKPAADATSASPVAAEQPSSADETPEESPPSSEMDQAEGAKATPETVDMLAEPKPEDSPSPAAEPESLSEPAAAKDAPDPSQEADSADPKKEDSSSPGVDDSTPV